MSASAGIDPAAEIGAVRLRVADAAATERLYADTIGLRRLGGDGGVTRLGVEQGRPLVELVEDASAPPRPARTTGLFHLALLFPSRLELARALGRVAEARWPLSGVADHLVSEALYLRDAEANGIELYRDLPREEWRRNDAGEYEIDTLPLDLGSLSAELEAGGANGAGAPPGTTIGHVHLEVADLDAADRFYVGALGFEPTLRTYPGALFVAAGGYHHHIGLNTWGRPNAAPPPGALGLDRFEVVLPDSGAVERTAARLEAAGAAAERTREGVETTDPSGNRLLLRTPE